MIKVAIFASGKGTNLENIINRDIPSIKASLVVTDKLCGALEIARTYGIEARTFFRNNYPTKKAMEEDIASLLIEREIDLIVLAGYMRLFSPWFVHTYYQKIINIHPSYLPYYKGKGAIEQAIKDGKKLYGVTVHYVDEGMDEGEILAQQRVFYDGLNKEELEMMVHQCEYELYPKVIAQIARKGELL